MQGLMQDRPLLISAILEHAARNHPASKVVSARPDGTLAHHTWPEIAARAAQLAHALTGRGVRQGERIATLAWNEHRHLEAYYGISSMGAVLHTVNPRLFPDQIAFILADAQD
ncbi:MAG: AMP-binding protein, partial [Acetobacteraceae bacterium]|nr:AMP-binding protein [Acetobacteraceae bacterium]